MPRKMPRIWGIAFLIGAPKRDRVQYVRWAARSRISDKFPDDAPSVPLGPFLGLISARSIPFHGGESAVPDGISKISIIWGTEIRRSKICRVRHASSYFRQIAGSAPSVLLVPFIGLIAARYFPFLGDSGCPVGIAKRAIICGILIRD